MGEVVKSEVRSVGPSYSLTVKVIPEFRLNVPVKCHGEEGDENGEHDPYCGLKDNTRNTTIVR